jgi:DNA repair exonuclease SbcCD nuclease subunit
MKAIFIHSADWQLGKPFGGIIDTDKQACVRRERIDVLGRLGDLAREREAEFVLVAGDLFDSIHPTNETVAQTFEVIAKMGLPVLAIPGNHDHGGPGGPWEQDFVLRLIKDMAPNFRILLDAEPVEMDTAIILPCPLLTKHTTTDPTEWVRDGQPAWEGLGDKPRVVLAHGSVHDFASKDADEESMEHRPLNMIDMDRLPASELDYIALGDWHGMKQVGGKAWYSGTPEPDRFPKGEDYLAGQALVVRASRGDEPEVKPVTVAGLRWMDEEFFFTEDNGPVQLKGRIDERLEGSGASCLLRLRLEGSLNLAAWAQLDKMRETWEALLLRLKLDDSTQTTPDETEMMALTQRAADPLISRVAGELVNQMNGEGDDANIARTALIQLHAACGGD